MSVSLEDYIGDSEVRRKLKDQLVEIQKIELYKRMVVSSKMDNVLLNGFKFDGKVAPYLLELDFHHARAVFMIRFRMMPTKCNFPSRWNGLLCNVCITLKILMLTYSPVLDFKIWSLRMFGMRCSGMKMC